MLGPEPARPPGDPADETHLELLCDVLSSFRHDARNSVELLVMQLASARRQLSTRATAGVLETLAEAESSAVDLGRSIEALRWTLLSGTTTLPLSASWQGITQALAGRARRADVTTELRQPHGFDPSLSSPVGAALWHLFLSALRAFENSNTRRQRRQIVLASSPVRAGVCRLQFEDSAIRRTGKQQSDMRLTAINIARRLVVGAGGTVAPRLTQRGQIVELIVPDADCQGSVSHRGNR